MSGFTLVGNTKLRRHQSVRGILWFAFIPYKIATDDSGGYTVGTVALFIFPSEREKQAQSSSNSPLLSAVYFFSLSMWNELCNFVLFFVLFFSSFAFLFLLACELILLFVALSVQWHIKKRWNMFFFLYKKNQNVFFNVCKSRVECWKKNNIWLDEKIYFLPCQSDMQNLLFFNFFKCMFNGKSKHVSMFSSTESLKKDFFSPKYGAKLLCLDAKCVY